MYDNRRSTARHWLVTPGLVGFLASPRIRSHPHRAYRFLRRLDPVHRSPSGIWVLSGHQEVNAALRHPAMGSDESKLDLSTIHVGPFRRMLDDPALRALREGRPVEEDPSSPALRLLRQLMLFRDPPDHTRLRSLVNKAFTPRAISKLEARITEIVDRQLARVVGQGRMEFLAEFAYPVPALVICELIGVPPDDHHLIARYAPALAARLDPSPMRNSSVHAEADRAVEELTLYLSKTIAARREQPGEDMLSNLIAAEADGNRLDQDELVGMAVLLLIAGHETTANLLGNGLAALLTDREQWSRYKTGEALDRTAIEELMRFDGPIQMTERIALENVQIGPTWIPKGSMVILCLAAANRDPDAFGHPDVLDLARDPNPHLGFGGGLHFCIGAPLARLEAKIALRSLAERIPEPSIATDKLKWRPSFTIRGLRELPLTWSTATVSP